MEHRPGELPAVAVIVADQHVAVLSPTADGGLAVDPLPRALALLDRLSAGASRIAVVVPDPAPESATVELPVDAVVVRAGRTPAETLAACVEAVGPLDGTLLVAADRTVRAEGARAGCHVAPDPAVAELLLDGVEPLFVRLDGEREPVARLAPLIPYWIDRHNDGTWSVLGVSSIDGVRDAVHRGVRADVLDLDVSLDDILLVRRDAGTPRGRIITSASTWTAYALAPDDVADALPAHGAHGHFVALAPNPDVLALPPTGDAWRHATMLLLRWPKDLIAIEAIEPAVPVLTVCASTTATFQADVDRYSGAAALDAAGAVTSRHSAHPDNPRVVQALLEDLRAIGYDCATRHAFMHGGRTLHNVVADLPGTGVLRRPRVFDDLREVIVKWPPGPPDPPWSQVRELLGAAWTRELGLEHLPPWRARQLLIDLADLKPWKPWRLCPTAGLGAEIVIVGCHLDSTGARDPGYDPATGMARGADDDASGIAAVLAAARGLHAQAGRLRHTVRFCFFNAEESGLVGSQAYATMLHATGAPVRAVVCADMIGYNSDTNRAFEVHAGATDPAVRDASVPIAQCIAAWAGAQGSLGPAQVYRGTNPGGGSDRTIYDPAINRSDHGSFQQQGYPAVVVSEDFFVNLATEAPPDANPNYHRAADNTVDANYGSSIACAITRAIQELAT